jgi:hypothetical protein
MSMNPVAMTVIPPLALEHHDFANAWMAPVDTGVVAAVEVVDDNRTVSMAFPVPPVMMPESLHDYDSRPIPLHDDDTTGRCTAVRYHPAVVAGVFVSRDDAPGYRPVTDHDFG